MRESSRRATLLTGLAVLALASFAGGSRAWTCPDASGYSKNEHADFSATRDGNDYVVTCRFRDHKEQMQVFTLHYPGASADVGIERYGVPASVLGPIASTVTARQDLERTLAEGMFRLEGNRIAVDWNRVVDVYRPFCRPIAEEIVAALDRYGTDSRRERIEMLMKFVQDIPYGIPEHRDSSRYFGGFMPPPQVLLCGFGDCDTKSVLFAGALSYLIEPGDIFFLEQPKHLLTAIRGQAGPGQSYVLHSSGQLVISETAGPGRLHLGEDLEYDPEVSYVVSALKLAAPADTLPPGSRKNLFEGYDPLSPSHKGEPKPGLAEELKRLSSEKREIHDIAFAPHGGWIVVFGESEFASAGIPREPLAALQRLRQAGRRIARVAFDQNDGWVVIHDAGFEAENLEPEVTDALSKLRRESAGVACVAFTAAGGWVILHESGFVGRGLPAEATKRLDQLVDERHAPRQIAFSDDDDWVILTENSYTSFGIPEAAAERIGQLVDQGEIPKGIYLAGKECWVILHGEYGFATRL